MGKQPEWEPAPFENLANEWPVCPHCSDNLDPTDFRSSEGSEQERDCPSCGKRMLIVADYSVTYSTYKPKEKP